MRGKRLAWAAGGAAALLLSSILYVLAGRPDDRPRRPVFSRQWESCDRVEACVAVQAPCGEWQPVSETHETDAAAYYGHLMTVVEETGMECVSTNLSTRRPAAYCVSGKCTISP